MLTAFGLGHMQPAPGTWGSLPPVVVAFVFVSIGVPHWETDVVLALMLILFSIACIRFGAMAEEWWGKKDPGRVVADEVAGQCLPLLFLPWREPDDWLINGGICASAFLMFRFLDIIKPPPARGLQRLAGGWGILIDDLFAGLYAAIVMQALVRIVIPAIPSLQ